MAELRSRPLQATDRDGVMRRSHNSVTYEFELLEEFRTNDYEKLQRWEIAGQYGTVG
jgi:hypothetical protein